MKNEITLNNKLFGNDWSFCVGSSEITVEQLYQAFKNRYIQERNIELAETVENTSVE